MPGIILAQIDASMIQLWFEESLEGGKLTISVNFLSEAEDLTVLEYDFEIWHEIKSADDSIHGSKGEFLAVQNLAIPLATKTINLEKSEPLMFIIRIFQVDQLITSKQYNWNPKNKITPQKAITPVAIQPATQSIPKPPVANQLSKVADKKTFAGDDFEIQGLIIDETRTKLGRDFYEIFFRKWIPPQNAGDDFIIKIKELPSFGRFARVTVEVSDHKLSERSLNPRIDIIELQANASIREARNYLSARSRLSSDLENEDTLGSGIY